MKKRFFIETFGCQMNKNDSELMQLSMTRNGFTPCGSSSAADVVIFNTCSVRDHAENRALAHIQAVKSEILSRRGVIAVTGCMAQRIGRDLVKRGDADIVIGPYQSPKIGEIISRYMKDRSINACLSQDQDDFNTRIDTGLAEVKTRHPWHRWVTITHGCENFCTYCIVPSVRGRLISFPSAEIIEYVKILAAGGANEITLLGQNVNQYGMDNNDIPFYRLLAEVSRIQGLDRINFITSHPKDFSENIIKVMQDNANISRSIHLPLQSGSDKILKFMNRHYSLGHYMDIISMIHATLPDYSLSTDIIVGFPGEDISDFSETLRAVREIQFDNAFMYAYSPRQGTPAFNMKDTVTKEEKIKRLQELIAIERDISRQKLFSRVDRVELAIMERISKKSDNALMGKTFLDHPVIIPGSKEDIGRKIQVKIEKVKGNTLQGHRIA